MAKNWRLAVCTRWRPLVVIGLVIVGWLVLALTSILLEEYQARRLEKKAQTLTVGMSEAELPKIMGHSFVVLPVESKSNLILSEDDEGHIVEYEFCAKGFFYESSTYFGGIFVDERTHKVVSIRLSSRFLLFEYGLLGHIWERLIVVLMGLMIWLLFRLWCKKLLRKDIPSSNA